jgi:hypothetical protein
MSRKQEQYKGFIAEAISFQLKGKPGFTVAFGVIADGKSENDETYAPSGTVYASDEEALEAGLRMAKRRIDDRSASAASS